MADKESESSEPQTLRHVVIYTDGAAEPNPGPGGYGVVLMSGKHRKELSAGFHRTTNNRMELMAVIVALESLTQPCRVTLYCDSKYVVESVRTGAVERWSKNGWYRTKTDRVKNADLWERFLKIHAKHQVRFQWVKGHAGVVENERCDELAVAAAKSYDTQPDEGYIRELMANGVALPDGNINEAIAKHAAAQPQGDRNVSHKEPGEPCRKCGTPIIKKPTKPKAHKPGQTYYYEWYLYCPGCNTMYLVDEAKRAL